MMELAVSWEPAARTARGLLFSAAVLLASVTVGSQQAPMSVADFGVADKAVKTRGDLERLHETDPDEHVRDSARLAIEAIDRAVRALRGP